MSDPAGRGDEVSCAAAARTNPRELYHRSRIEPTELAAFHALLAVQPRGFVKRGWSIYAQRVPRSATNQARPAAAVPNFGQGERGVLADTGGPIYAAR